MILKLGDRGPDVEQLQLKLKAAGYDPGDIDGDFGAKTQSAVLAFQEDRPNIDDDGVAGPQTLGALDAAVAKRQPTPDTPVDTTTVPCGAEMWTAFRDFVDKITTLPVRYGPGRGLWVNDHFTVTDGPGALGVKIWPNVLGHAYPSFHCTSWCNFFLGWLLRRNQDYTHAGNIPSMFDLLEKGPEIHQNPGAGPWRGYGDSCFPITPDGSAVKRHGVPKVVDARELYARRGELPTFVIFCQSSKIPGGWNWWHHTGVWVCYEDKLYRIAADGYKGKSGYSATPMQWMEITPANVGAFDSAIYRVYGVRSKDGTYGDQFRPLAPLEFES